MRPPQDQVFDSSASSRSQSKRRLHETQSASNNTVPASDAYRADQLSSESNLPKKLKTSPFSGNLGSRPNPTKTTAMSRTQVIDLRPSNFQPHTGAKRLVIKNLRTTSRNDAEKYYEKTWKELDDALTSVFANKQPIAPLEVLCRGVEATCRRGRSQELYAHLERRCQAHIKDELLPQIKKQAGSNAVDTLRTVQRVWGLWKDQLVCLRQKVCVKYLLTCGIGAHEIHFLLSR
jgi:cullin-4